MQNHTAAANSLQYADPTAANVQREYELTFVSLTPLSDGQQHTTVTWALDCETTNAMIAERLQARQALVSVREVYSRVLTFQPMWDELLRK